MEGRLEEQLELAAEYRTRPSPRWPCPVGEEARERQAVVAERREEEAALERAESRRHDVDRT